MENIRRRCVLLFNDRNPAGRDVRCGIFNFILICLCSSVMVWSSKSIRIGFSYDRPPQARRYESTIFNDNSNTTSFAWKWFMLLSALSDSWYIKFCILDNNKTIIARGTTHLIVKYIVVRPTINVWWKYDLICNWTIPFGATIERFVVHIYISVIISLNMTAIKCCWRHRSPRRQYSRLSQQQYIFFIFYLHGCVLRM